MDKSKAHRAYLERTQQIDCRNALYSSTIWSFGPFLTCQTGSVMFRSEGPVYVTSPPDPHGSCIFRSKNKEKLLWMALAYGAALRFLRPRGTQSWFPARHLWQIDSPGLNSHLTCNAVKNLMRTGGPLKYIGDLTLSDLQCTQAADLYVYVNIQKVKRDLPSNIRS